MNHPATTIVDTPAKRAVRLSDLMEEVSKGMETRAEQGDIGMREALHDYVRLFAALRLALLRVNFQENLRCRSAKTG